MSGWLHMGGVPPRTTLNLDRRSIGGRRFVVHWLPVWGSTPGRREAGQSPLDWALGSGGTAAALALIAEPGRAAPYDFAELAGRARAIDGARDPFALGRAVGARLAGAGVPWQVGVFADDDARDDGDVHVADGVALAILLRRSGPLFMPTREPQLSLVVPKLTTLVFPEDPDVESR